MMRLRLGSNDHDCLAVLYPLKRGFLVDELIANGLLYPPTTGNVVMSRPATDAAPDYASKPKP